tara:strand:- start:3102 stop:3581 length:480 start_codon:yes stop_codon:yes gene_type:complete
MEKRSTVKSVQSNGTFDFNGKTFYKYEIEMENGDVGEYNSISEKQSNFIVDVAVDYIYDQSKPQYPKIKPVYNFKASPSRDGNLKNIQKALSGIDREKLIVKQTCLKCAVEYVGPNSQYANVKDVTKIAQVFADWVLEDKEPEVKEQPKRKKETTDLPF